MSMTRTLALSLTAALTASTSLALAGNAETEDPSLQLAALETGILPDLLIEPAPWQEWRISDDEDDDDEDDEDDDD